MTRHEIVIQWLKIFLALVGGSYFLWWSLQVLHLLKPPEAPSPAKVVTNQHQ